jgi:catechol 2,3-dioxygenase-like lactoylglutathione lyase family enzyme
MSAPPPVLGILESALYVTDLERSAAFYARVFGFAEMLADARMRALAVPGRQVLLLFRHGGSLVASPTPFGVIPPHDGHGQLHLCFAIKPEELAAWAAHLARLEIAVESRVAWEQGAVSLYFRDPDGHSLEVATTGLWPNDPVDEPTVPVTGSQQP